MFKIKMAEEDEIDILGDFNLDNFLSKNNQNVYEPSGLSFQNSELLNCDYTIHPQWLLDKPSANPDNWYSDSNILEKTQNDTEVLGHVSTENCITDESGWTEKEKNLLDRGIEIFGKSNVRLSQFIGSKSASEIKYYLKNFYSDNHSLGGFNEVCLDDLSGSNLVSDILDDTQIPASIEEVIAAVSTAKPTVQLNKRFRKKSEMSEFDIKDIPSGQSLLKSNYLKSSHESPPYKDSKGKSMGSKKGRSKQQNCKFKFKTKLKFPLKEKDVKMQVRQKIVRVMNESNRKPEMSKVEITTGKGLSVPICEGEEIIKIEKVENDSDEDIEIDVEDEEDSKNPLNFNVPSIKSEPAELTAPIKTEPKEEIVPKAESTKLVNNGFDPSSVSKEAMEELTSMEEPSKEIILKEDDITETEKLIHWEFFEGRPTKTPQRYLKIRNHILNSWYTNKPSYITKTSIRLGLKNCGDVNCISRIHYYLEQIGAINFGCAQTSYVRPLYDMIQASPIREKTVKETGPRGQSKFGDFTCRPRVKKKFSNDGEGGCTLTHDEKGQVINTTIVNEEPQVKQRICLKKPSIRLIYCRPFSDEKPQIYKVKLHLETLLKMDFHAHSSLTEVMGLVAGYWVHESQTLIISHYEPCKNIASSATHCDMCPISQARASDIIHNKGLDILGWFHSHPTFAPEPSQQDLDTQQIVQQWIGSKKPCIGFILSPFSSNGALIASPYRCMMVDKKLNFEDQFIPYKFKVDLITEGFDCEKYLRDIEYIMNFDNDNCKESRVDFRKPYFQDLSLSYLEKFISSVRMHLAKCGQLNKMACDKIIQGITDVCSNN